MKNTLATLALCACCSTGLMAQHDHNKPVASNEMNHIMFQDEKMSNAYGAYVLLKDAFVASDNAKAKDAAGELQKSLTGVANSSKASEIAASINKSSSLEEQRKSFRSLSDEMAKLVKAGKLSMGSIYLEYCPMANNNAGAFWLSNEKEIKNPYFGDMMLKCGSVKETIH